MIEAPLTTEQRRARGEVRCIACKRWFKPAGACATRCVHCMSAFYKRAVSNQWINPIVNPAWPGLTQKEAPANMPHA